jgi:hypothetical protein
MLGAWLRVAALAPPGTALAQALQPYVVVGDAIANSCISGIRAQPYDTGAPELVELELYLMSRARGMPIETPAVRP